METSEATPTVTPSAQGSDTIESRSEGSLLQAGSTLGEWGGSVCVCMCGCVCGGCVCVWGGCVCVCVGGVDKISRQWSFSGNRKS